MKKLIVFTDLDGTLLSHGDYSFTQAHPALRALMDRDIPLIICSSKTRCEIEVYRERFQNRHPFVSENGGGIFVPAGYFGEHISVADAPVERSGGYQVVRLGVPYGDLRAAIKDLREKEGFAVRGFGDMTVEEVAQLTGLSPDEAALAKERDFDEPFVIYREENDMTRLVAAIESRGLRHTRGTYHHLMGDSDKGRAVSVLIRLYALKFGDIVTLALGDSPNDAPMLARVDVPVLVKRSAGTYDAEVRVPGVRLAAGVGPAGWNSAVLEVLDELDGAD